MSVIAPSSLRRPPAVQLRRPTTDDIPSLFEMQLDPEANRLAGTHPRDRDAFHALWNGMLSESPSSTTRAIPRVILADGALVGSINIFPHQELHAIGYWIAKEHWGRGIATRAIALMIAEVATRPLFAEVVVHNAASCRALEKNGFVVIGRRHAPATERYVASELVELRLDAPAGFNEGAPQQAPG